MKRSAAALLAVILASGCAGIPSSGPVTRVAVDKGFGQSTVRYAPARPSAGASPQQIVRGYLEGMLAFPAATGTAAAFLTPDAARRWDSLASVRVYSRAREASPSSPGGRGTDAAEGAGARVEVRLTVTDEARLDRQGRYTRLDGRSTEAYRLEQVKGEWRIANPQVGLLINRKYFTDYFRPFNIFLFDRPGKRLVPVPVYLPVGEQLTTALVTSLARGPRPDPDRHLRTYVPKLTTLRPSVPLTEDGIADLAFDEDFGAVTESEQERLAAQIVWTLRQVPGVQGARMVGATSALTPRGLAVQPIDSWGSFGPSISRGKVFGLAGDRVVKIDGGRVEPLTGAWGKDARGAVLVAVSDAGVAGVLAGRSQVRVTKRDGTGPRLIGGNAFVAPRWDEDGGLWLVDRGSRTRVQLSQGALLRTLPIGDLADLDVTSFSLSADGSRYAVTATRGTSSAIYVGAILRDGKDRVLGLGGPVRVSMSVARPSSVVWLSGTSLSFLADSESGRQVYTALIDGSSTSGGISGSAALLPDVGADTLVLGTGASPPRYATDARDRVWYLPPGGSWRRLDTRGVTGLTSGR